MQPLLRRWNLRCVDVRLDSFGADKPDLAGSRLPGRHRILMTVITLDRTRALDRGQGPRVSSRGRHRPKQAETQTKMEDENWRGFK